jgi:hypothetical protein
MESLLRETIKVSAIFEERGRMRTVHFLWRGRKYTVLKVNYTWNTREGRTLFKHFSVFDGTNHFHLVFNAEEMEWELNGVYFEG